MGRWHVIKRMCVVLAVVLLRFGTTSWAEEANEFVEFIPSIELEAKPASEYQESLSWDLLTEKECVKMGVDFDTVSRCGNVLAGMSEGDIVEINSSEYEQLKKSGILSSLGITYIEAVDESDINQNMTVYLKDGVKHSMFTSDDENVESMTADDFRSMIDYDAIETAGYSSRSENTQIGTVIREIPHSGSYGHWQYTCKYYIRYIVNKSNDSDSVSDYYTVHAIYTVNPCIVPDNTYCTQYHSSGIAAHYADEYILQGKPNSGAALNHNSTQISLSVGYPWTTGLSFSLDLENGTEIVSGASAAMHDIAFSNNEGIYSPSSVDGSFEYETMTLFLIPDGRTFSFQHNHYMMNAVYKNGNSPSTFYDDWVVVVPQAEPEPEPEPSRYVADGLDYGLVFDSDYYLLNNMDVYNAYGNDWIAAFQHFLNNGMAEARIAKATFNVVTYRNRYADLNSAFGDDWVAYYRHYIQHGYAEGRSGM